MKKTLLSIMVLLSLAFSLPGALASDRNRESRQSAGIPASETGIDVQEMRRHGDIHRPRFVLGEVISIDRDKRIVTIRDFNTNLDTSVILHAEDLPKVKVGDEVKAVLQPETNVAQSVIIEKEK